MAFKRFFPGEVSVLRLSLFLSLIGFVNCTLGSAPMVALGLIGAEQRFWASELATTSWVVILGGCGFVLVFNSSIAIGIAVTTPLFISVGTELVVPATMLVDLLRGASPPWTQWLGSGLLIASFAVLLCGMRQSHEV